MRRSSRRESEDHSSAKKRTLRSSDSRSPRRGSPERTSKLDLDQSEFVARKRDEKKDDKRDEKKNTYDLRNHHKSASEEKTNGIANGKPLAKDPGSFENFPEISAKSIEGLKKRGINALFPVQYETFYTVYKREDLIVRDLTGSGKTLGFALPLVEYLRKNKHFGTGKIQGIVLAPTRELALQVSKEFNLLKHYDSEYNVLTVYGGVSLDDQTRELRKGVDIFVGTTGRVLDHMERRNFNFTDLKTIILDEADQMLKLGFKEDVERIMTNIKEKAPQNVQMLLFSATVPSWVRKVAESYLTPGFRTIDLAVNLKNKTSKTVNHLAINCPYQNRISALADILVCYGGIGQTIVFCSTKQEANSLLLSDKIKKDIEVMHGDIAQNQREVTLKRFKENKFSVLVATDVASRGLDIPNVDLVIQVEPPKEAETYIHRSGRTARAGRTGTCITFYSKKHQPLIQMIEQKAGIQFQKIGIPQPEDVIKASSRDTLKNLDQVNDDVLPLFEDAADILIKTNGGDARKALQQTLAYMSGHYKNVLGSRSLLTGEEKYITFEMKVNQSFHGISFIWNILRKHVPEQMTNLIRGMRTLKEMNGVVFDVPEEIVERFEDIFNHQKESHRLDFEIGRAKSLPELKEDTTVGYGQMGAYGNTRYGGQSQGYGGQSQGYGGQSQGYGNRGGSNNQGGYGGRDQGYGGQSQSYGGRDQSSGPPRGGRNDDSKTVFVGNLGFNSTEKEIEDIFRKEGLRTNSIRLLQDHEGKFKGACFVEFPTEGDMERACKLNGVECGDQRRRIRINPAGNKPPGR